MAVNAGPNIVEDGLVLSLDAGNPKSYPGTGNIWYDVSGQNNNFTIDANGFSYNSNGYFSLVGETGGIYKSGTMNTSSTCTCVFFIKTSDLRALFWGSTVSGSNYLGAYRVDNKYYNGLCGSPTFFMDLQSRPNVYDYFPDNNWHMLEFKSVDFSAWSDYTFNRYASTVWRFDNAQLAYASIYNKNLTAEESAQNYAALRGRFGL